MRRWIVKQGEWKKQGHVLIISEAGNYRTLEMSRN